MMKIEKQYQCPYWYYSFIISDLKMAESMKRDHESVCEVKNQPGFRCGSLIPCDECERSIPFSQYEKHLDSHKKTVEEYKSIQSNIGKIPCEICNKAINFRDYDGHLKTHEQAPPAPIHPAPVPAFGSHVDEMIDEMEEEENFAPRRGYARTIRCKVS